MIPYIDASYRCYYISFTVICKPINKHNQGEKGKRSVKPELVSSSSSFFFFSSLVALFLFSSPPSQFPSLHIYISGIGSYSTYIKCMHLKLGKITDSSTEMWYIRGVSVQSADFPHRAVFLLCALSPPKNLVSSNHLSRFIFFLVV